MSWKLYASLLAGALAATTLLAPSALATNFCSPQAVTNSGPITCNQMYATFKVFPSGVHDPAAPDDVNAASGAEQPLPCLSYVPSELCGVSDIIVKNPSTDGTPTAELAALASSSGANTVYGVMDQKLYLSPHPAVETPGEYLLATVTGTPATPESGTFFIWFGYWDNAQGDNQFHDIQCPPNDTMFCPSTDTSADGPQADNFVWRGLNTNENNMYGVGWTLPGEYDPSGGPGVFTGPTGGNFGVQPVEFGSGLAGDCHLYQTYDPDCVSPRPSYGITDNSNNDLAGSNQRWIIGGSWPALPVTDALITNHYFVSVIGTPSMQTSDYYTVNPQLPASTPGFFLDYNYYQSVTDDAITPMFMTAAHAVRNNYNDVNYNILAPLSQQIVNATSIVPGVNTDSTETCPTSPAAVCYKDTRQAVALANHASVTPASPAAPENPYMSAYLQDYIPLDDKTPGTDFASYWCGQAGAPAAVCSNVVAVWPTSHGLYGYDSIGGVPFLGQGLTSVEPSFTELWGSFNAFTWVDANGDGFIGNPYPDEIQGYESGQYPTANIAHTGNLDLVTGNAEGWFTSPVHGIVVVPPASGWPPGTFEDQNSVFATPFGEAPLGNPAEGSHLLAISGASPITLRATPQLCGGANCVTQDGLIMPADVLVTLSGYTGPVTMNWNGLNGQAYSFTSNSTFVQTLGQAPQPGQ